MSVEPADDRTRTEEPGERTSRDYDELSADAAFTLLRNPRRRAVVRHLRAEPETTLGELAERIAAAETDTDPARLDSEERKRVYISLYQSHLPRLADAGVVEYDRNRGTVRRLPAAHGLERRLDRFEAAEAGSTLVPGRYVGVAVGLFAVAGAAGVPPFGAVGAVWWAVVCIVTLFALATAGSRSER